MNEPNITIRELLEKPEVQKHIAPENIENIETYLNNNTQLSDPLYIRILIGIGAWFATGFILSALGMLNLFDNETVLTICGAILVTVAIALSKFYKSTFLNQVSLALILTGNTMLIIGVTQQFKGSEVYMILLTHSIVCAVAYPLFRSSIYRFLAPMMVVTFAMILIIDKKMYDIMHFLIIGEVILTGIFFLRKFRPAWLTPLAYSAAAALPATLLTMNLIQQNTWWDINIPVILWPSSSVLVCALIYLYFYIAGSWKRYREPWMILAIISTILLGIFSSPGILIAIALLILGYTLGDKILMAMSFIFLPCFLVLFYHALNVDLAYKSGIVAGSGILLLLVRWIAVYCLPQEVKQ